MWKMFRLTSKSMFHHWHRNRTVNWGFLVQSTSISAKCSGLARLPNTKYRKLDHSYFRMITWRVQNRLHRIVYNEQCADSLAMRLCKNVVPSKNVIERSWVWVTMELNWPCFQGGRDGIHFLPCSVNHNSTASNQMSHDESAILWVAVESWDMESRAVNVRGMTVSWCTVWGKGLAAWVASQKYALYCLESLHPPWLLVLLDKRVLAGGWS